MPYISLKQSSNIKNNINFESLFKEFHLIIQQTIGAPISACKSHALIVDDYYLGDGAMSNALVLVELTLMSGRSNELKDQLGQAILKCLQQCYAKESSEIHLEISLRLIEMDKINYFNSK